MKLFIYIPTYNRNTALSKQLQSLIPQIIKYKDCVRVFVNDNCSPDSIIESIKKKLPAPNIEYRRNPGNINGNANISLGFIFAQEDEFLWILGDNDFIRQNALDLLIPILEKNSDFDLINLNPDIDDINAEVYKWDDGWKYDRFTLISNVIYNMKTVAPYTSSLFYYHNSSFPHVALIISTVRGISKIKVLSVPRKNIFDQEISSREHPADYSLSYAGFLTLALLLPPKRARTFCLKYLLSRLGIKYHLNRKKHPLAYGASAEIVKKNGLLCRIVFYVTRINAMLVLLFLCLFEKKLKRKYHFWD
jgi:hypothetical protein